MPIRHDLLPFIEESVRLNQVFLEDEEKAMTEKEKVQERYEEEKAQKHKEEGRKEGEEQTKLDLVKKMISRNKTNEDILDLIDGLNTAHFKELRRDNETDD